MLYRGFPPSRRHTPPTEPHPLLLPADRESERKKTRLLGKQTPALVLGARHITLHQLQHEVNIRFTIWPCCTSKAMLHNWHFPDSRLRDQEKFLNSIFRFYCKYNTKESLTAVQIHGKIAEEKNILRCQIFDI